MNRSLQHHLTPYAFVALGAMPLVQPCAAQVEANRDSLASEAVAEKEVNANTPSRYNLWIGPAQMALSVGLRTEYSDNVFLRHDDVRDDFILSPRINLDSTVPIRRLNALTLNVGVAYYRYLKNEALNSDTPIVNPDSELAFHIYTGDFAIKLSENFSYQESPYHEYGGSFYNVYNTGRFARFDNRIGPTVTWDLKDLIVTSGYSHENFFSNEQQYKYINRSSEQFNASAMLALTPSVSAGLEGTGSINSFENLSLNDQWRAGGGPALQLALTEYVTGHIGAGYETIHYTSPLAPLYGLSAQNTYYVYASVDHTINRLVQHSLSFSQDNQIGLNAANLEEDSVTYSLTWKVNERLTVTPRVSVTMYKESYNSGRASLYNESFTYYTGGMTAAYDLSGKWRVGLSWSGRLKDSNVERLGYSQNLARLDLTYRF